MRVRAYTLAELVISLVVLAAAIALAAATLRGVARDAENQVANSSLAAVAFTAMVHYEANGFLTADPDAWPPVPSDLEVTDEPASAPGQVSVAMNDAGDLLMLAVLSEQTGMCHFATVGPGHPLTFAEPLLPDSDGACDPQAVSSASSGN